MKRVFTKKRLEFKNRESGEIVTTGVMAFCELPEWTQHDSLYGWAKADGDLEEFGEKKSSKRPGKELNQDGVSE